MSFIKNGEQIKQIGYGAMVLEGYYGQSDDTQAIDTLVYAINNNMMIDSADAYGAGHNELLIKEAIKKADKEPFIATKFGIVYDESDVGTKIDTGWGFPLMINGRAEYVKKSIDLSLQRLGVEKIDLMYAHYLDPEVPVEETIGAMSEAIKEGKIDAIGLSNINIDDIKRASKVEKISAIQYEYSIARRELENGMLSVIDEIGASLVCWSPLANGILSGNVDNIPEGDFRNNNPKYQGENFQSNLEIIKSLKEIANDLGITTSQLALAWLINRGENIIPIPGSRKISRVDENLQALNIKLDDTTMKLIDKIAPIGAFKGQTLV
jgi:aryl-alcohol dehydrogenase-like predicted oxidoreductase